MTATVEIDKLGRLVVPKKMRDALHLRPGDKLSIEIEEDHLKLEPQRPGKGLYCKDGLWVYDSGVPMTEEESLRLVDDAREERIQMLINGVMKP